MDWNFNNVNNIIKLFFLLFLINNISITIKLMNKYLKYIFIIKFILVGDIYMKKKKKKKRKEKKRKNYYKPL